MKSSPTLQLMMAAIIYLSLLWGYLILHTPQHFAAFTALVLCIAVFSWGNGIRSLKRAATASASVEVPGSMDSASSVKPVDEPTLTSSMKKLDALKAELSEQYAQFGKDQTAMNSKALGTWQRGRKSGYRE